MNGLRVAAATGVLAACASAGWAAETPQALAAGCASMTLDYGVPSGSGVVLVPQHVSIPYGGCVVFTNETATTATITVSGGYRATVDGFGASTTGARRYVGRTAGRHAVTATSGPATTTGSITVAAPASSSLSQPSSSPSRQPTHRGPAATSGAGSPSARSSATGPQVAPGPKRLKPPAVPPARPVPVSSVLAPSPGPTPEVAPSSSAAAVVSGPLEPPTDRGVGLPAALAVLAVVGCGAGLVRVLLAEPVGAVDSGQTVGGAV